jgi:hypothetical protein
MALLDHQMLKEPDLHCPLGRKITWMCLNSNCETSLFCSDDHCKTCAHKHDSCPVTKLSGLTNELNQQVKNCKELFIKIVEIDNFLVSELKRSQREFFRDYSFKNLHPKDQQTIDGVFRKNSSRLSGRDAKDLKARIEAANYGMGPLSAKTTDWYQKKVKEVAASL